MPSESSVTYLTNTRFEDVCTLLRTMQREVLRLGVGRVDIRIQDDAMKLQIGWLLFHRNQPEEGFRFFAGIAALKQAPQEAGPMLSDLEGRIILGRMVAEGQLPTWAEEVPA